MNGEPRHRCMWGAFRIPSLLFSRMRCAASQRPKPFVPRATTMPFFAGTVVHGCYKAILVFAKRESPKHSMYLTAHRSEFILVKVLLVRTVTANRRDEYAFCAQQDDCSMLTLSSAPCSSVDMQPANERARHETPQYTE